MEVGERIEHPQHGSGVVRRVRGMRELFVEFDRTPGLLKLVRSTEIVGVVVRMSGRDKETPTNPAATQLAPALPLPQPTRPPPLPPAPPPQMIRPSVLPPAPPPSPVLVRPAVDRAARLRLLEALRLGVVPHAHAEDYTVGREPVLRGLRGTLERVRTGRAGAFSVVLGDYGTGKTHLLEWIRERALADGFLVAQVALGTGDVTPEHPKRIYRALIQSLTYPGSEERARGLRPFFQRLIERGRLPKPSTDPGAHKYLDPVLHYFRTLTERGHADVLDRLLDWVEGHPSGDNVDWNHTLRRQLGGPYLYTLADYRTFAHVYAYLLGGIATLATEAGWSGLVVLFDEAEMYRVLAKEARDFADNVFRCYAVAALGTGGVRFPLSDIHRGGQPVHRNIPVLYTARQPLAGVFFLTPDDHGRAALGRCVDLSRHQVDLDPLSHDDYTQLCERIFALYRETHPEIAGSAAKSPARALASMLHRGVDSGAIHNPRAAVRIVMEFLDIGRKSPNHAGLYLAELQDAL